MNLPKMTINTAINMSFSHIELPPISFPAISNAKKATSIPNPVNITRPFIQFNL